MMDVVDFRQNYNFIYQLQTITWLSNINLNTMKIIHK